MDWVTNYLRPIPNQNTDCYGASMYPSTTMLRIGYGAGNRALSATEVKRLYQLGN